MIKESDSDKDREKYNDSDSDSDNDNDNDKRKQGGFSTYDYDNNSYNNMKPNIIEVNCICKYPLKKGKVGLVHMIMITR